jgi:Flp pilus assembly protein TadG
LAELSKRLAALQANEQRMTMKFLATTGMRGSAVSTQNPLLRIRGLRNLLGRSRSEEGQSLVEFAFTILMFLLLVFATIDFGHMFFVELEVQDAIQEAARYGTTGNQLTITNADGTQTILSRVNSIITILQQNSLGVTIPTSNVQITSLAAGATTPSPGAGGPGDLVTITATVTVPLWTPLVAQIFPTGYTFKASVTIENEQFQPS